MPLKSASNIGVLVALVLATLVLVVSSTGASNTGVSTSATVLVAPVRATMLLVAGSASATSTGATFIEAPVLLTMWYNAQNTLLMVHFTELSVPW